MICFQRCFFCLCLLYCCLDTLLTIPPHELGASRLGEGLVSQDEADIFQGLGDLGSEFHSPQFDPVITVPNGPCIQTITNKGTETPRGTPDTSLFGVYWFGEERRIAPSNQWVSRAEEVDLTIAPHSSKLNLKLDVDQIASHCSLHSFKSKVHLESSNLELEGAHQPPKTSSRKRKMRDINALYPPEISQIQDKLATWAAIGKFEASGPKDPSQILWSLAVRLDKKLDPRSRKITRSLEDFQLQLDHRAKLLSEYPIRGSLYPSDTPGLESLSIKLIPHRLNPLRPNQEPETLVRIARRRSVLYEVVQIRSLFSRVKKLLSYVVAAYNFGQERGDSLREIEYTQAELIDWFWKLIFESDDEGLPLVGWTPLTYPIENPESLFGDVKKALAKTLSDHENLRSLMPVCISISLLGYWYRTTALKRGDLHFRKGHHYFEHLAKALRDE